jgi:methionyl-tRNA formyltransferase
MVRFAFFGTSPLAEHVLPALERHGLVPSLIVAAPDAMARRGKELVAPFEKQWAIEHDISYLQPTKLDSDFLCKLQAASCQLFVVASYGKILPAPLLAMPQHGTINLHPSLLPRLRGASPMRSAILEDEKRVGVSIMLLDDKMDHGPILAQREVPTPTWPMKGRDLDALLGTAGAELLAETVPRWIDGEIALREQDHAQATYTRMFSKEDGRIDLADDGYRNLLKIRAFDGWPGTYTMLERRGVPMRVRITEAHQEHGKLVLDTVIPEGKKEMAYADFMRGV